MKLNVNDTIVFEGDSLTRREMGKCVDSWPYLRLMGWEKNWAEIFSELIFCWRPELKLTFRHAAIGGSNSRDIIARQESVMGYKPNWIILTIGNNDTFQGITLEEFEENINKYINRAKDISCKVIFMGGFIASPHATKEDEQNYEKKAAYYQVLERICKKTGNYYLDVGYGMEKRARILYEQSEIHTVYSDGPHYNLVGNNIIAGELMQAFGILNINK